MRRREGKEPRPIKDGALLLDKRQAALLLGLSARTIHDWGAAGLIERVPIGNRLVMYKRSEIEHIAEHGIEFPEEEEATSGEAEKHLA